ncbi:type II toxin-antitoxin system Phd/YefM family antitoxin [Conexibacter sp. DBS9H8]|uniref:type II toxin-antitoxin system Phd/YefM family antitoxin n=1 Tax=Conexibacter sp. DBS9H8 TaxID=2937801 RepID=UPI00200DC4F8|nr:type II toxin-antitoxin system prevent-host-death family antitoxin [Conexibacter sp. DBS9H8]
MATVIPQRELRNNDAEILNRVEAGESFTVTRHGVAVADVVPHTGTPKPPRFPKTADLVCARRQLPALEWQTWVHDIRASDGFLDGDLT